MLNTEIDYYSALASRDARFDGVFFVGVTSTGIYCRPICTAKTPKPSNCRFFKSPEEAEKASFRPCLRCRPELAPGSAPVDDSHRISGLIVQRLREGILDDEAGLEGIADQFELSSRQIRRILKKELGVSPIELIQTRRLLLAKQLLTETKLSMTDIAFASGFSSLRRFNDAFLTRYSMAPSRLRKEASQDEHRTGPSVTSSLQLSYRAPYDWHGMLGFLKKRMLKGIEWITDDFYARTVHIDGCKGWIRIRQTPEKNSLTMEFTHSLTPVLPGLLSRIRHLFDLDARPDVIEKSLKKSKTLAKMIRTNPGLRVPGAFDGLELAIRAVLGQQVTVKAATTLSCRFAETFGEKYETPFIELHSLSPIPERIARATVGDIAKLGIISARARCIIAIAHAYISNSLKLEPGTHPEHAISQLTALPGIGAWTAHYITMRALRWPDAFPKEDIVIRNNLGGITAKQAEELSQAWRPWRSYAVLHIWNSPPPKKAN